LSRDSISRLDLIILNRSDTSMSKYQSFYKPLGEEPKLYDTEWSVPRTSAEMFNYKMSLKEVKIANLTLIVIRISKIKSCIPKF
jgi:hypothetical protein